MLKSFSIVLLTKRRKQVEEGKVAKKKMEMIGKAENLKH